MTAGCMIYPDPENMKMSVTGRKRNVDYMVDFSLLCHSKISIFSGKINQLS